MRRRMRGSFPGVGDLPANAARVRADIVKPADHYRGSRAGRRNVDPADMTALSGHRFWPGVVAAAEAHAFTSVALVDHRQITDAYLLAFAGHHDGRLATLDEGLVELIPDRKERARRIALVRGP